MKPPLSVSYKSSASIVVYRDGGSLELRFIANDDNDYCIFIEVVHDSPADCKRYQVPILFKGSFDINNIRYEDFIDYLTWQNIKEIISKIKMDIGQHAYNQNFDLIENITDNNGWLVIKENS